MTATPAPERLLEDLNPSQREAVTATSGPLAIVAGAGSGKTRVISRRAAYAIETGAVPADQILLVTFTDKAAGEMVERMAALGHRGVMARTFHAAALAQLRHFWPSRHDGAPLPAILDSKLRLLVPLVGRLPGGYKFTPAKDVADTIEWAKVRRIRPDRWVAEGGDRAPIPADLFARVYRDYERSKAQAGLLDFEDMLVETVELLEGDAEAAALVRSRKRWFSVDEYQDTNPLSERLLELWLGESRDLAVVGDPDQTIYTFTGATPDFLLGFAERHPGRAHRHPRRQLPLQPADPGARQPARWPAGRAASCARRSRPGRRLRSTASRTREAELREIVAWVRAVGGRRRGADGDGGPGPDQRPAAGHRGCADAGRDRVHGARPAVLRPARDPRGAAAPAPRSRRPRRAAALAAAVERLFVERMGLDDVAADAGSGGPRAGGVAGAAARHRRGSRGRGSRR